MRQIADGAELKLLQTFSRAYGKLKVVYRVAEKPPVFALPDVSGVKSFCGGLLTFLQGHAET